MFIKAIPNILFVRRIFRMKHILAHSPKNFLPAQAINSNYYQIFGLRLFLRKRCMVENGEQNQGDCSFGKEIISFHSLSTKLKGYSLKFYVSNTLFLHQGKIAYRAF